METSNATITTCTLHSKAEFNWARALAASVMHFAYFELISREFRNRFWFFLHLFIHKQSQYKHTLGYLICSITIPQ